MSTIGWILLIALFVGLHLMMHRGHGSHVGRGAGRLARGGHQHSIDDDRETTATAGPARRRHGGC
jgi:hypothetical protein